MILGMEVAALAFRQIACCVAVVSAIIGFILLFNVSGPAKLVGVRFFVLPTGIF